MKEKNDKESVVIAFCSLYKDWISHKENIIKSFLNLNNAFQGECFFILCIQNFGDNAIDSNLGLLNHNIIYLTEAGISLARNRCIDEAQSMNCKWIMFHDATIYWPSTAARFIYDKRFSEIPPKLKLRFSEVNDCEIGNHESSIKKINPIYDTYIGAMLLNLNVIGSLRFNELHGPGDKTFYKSGEDVLFSFDYFYQKGKFEVCEANELEIYHPPRLNDFEKHKVYARGQGRVFRILLSKYFSLQLVFDSILFFGNAIFRCFLYKKNSFTILSERIVGFLDEV
ncbi:hypothetical protein [Pectobacterium carotovorum]|uniref:hypothetical protein n=1 Tax=Pectobacterium carotovorum TaxID=554 RepID=UPI003019C1BE